jgi:hypothetical protein
VRVPDDLGRPQLDCRWMYITRLGALPRPRPNCIRCQRTVCRQTNPVLDGRLPAPNAPFWTSWRCPPLPNHAPTAGILADTFRVSLISDPAIAPHRADMLPSLLAAEHDPTSRGGGGGELLSPLSCGRFGRWWSLCSGRRTAIRSRLDVLHQELFPGGAAGRLHCFHKPGERRRPGARFCSTGQSNPGLW